MCLPSGMIHGAVAFRTGGDIPGRLVLLQICDVLQFTNWATAWSRAESGGSLLGMERTGTALGLGLGELPPCHEAACTCPVTGSSLSSKEARSVLGQLLLLESHFFD